MLMLQDEDFWSDFAMACNGEIKKLSDLYRCIPEETSVSIMYMEG